MTVCMDCHRILSMIGGEEIDYRDPSECPSCGGKEQYERPEPEEPEDHWAECDEDQT